MGLKDLQQVWEDWARADPLWAILSYPSKTERRWDSEEFFLTGKAEIQEVMDDLARRSIAVRRGRALDFGCGVGRLTQALAEFFERCDGVDISPTMVDRAREYNRFPERCTFHVNGAPDLQIFPSGSFDFIYSNIVLQHIEPELSERYVREFVRILANGGLAMFQVPSAFVGIPEAVQLPEGAHQASITLAAPVPRMVAGVRAPVRVAVRNASDHRWPLHPNLRLGNHWRSADGDTVLTLDDGRITLMYDVEPGQTSVLELVVEPPARPGRYVLELDVVEEAVCWFADRGSPTLRLPVEVAAPQRAKRTILGWRGARRSRGGSAKLTPRLFEMHALPRERVVEAVESSGGRILDIESYNPSGVGWESYRYYVTTA